MVEVLVVMAIILVLAGLVLGTSSYVHNRGARSRAEAEIAAISAALENYKADNGVYPSSALDPAIADPAEYRAASTLLYETLSGDSDGDGQANTDVPSYLTFRPNQLETAASKYFVKDPFGNSYGYSTAKADNPAGSVGYNPTFDLWSTAGFTDSKGKSGWIKNW
jgi:type II secretory pathway pseudopilin PulG